MLHGRRWSDLRESILSGGLRRMARWLESEPYQKMNRDRHPPTPKFRIHTARRGARAMEIT
jgi:hypothetical protein